MRIVRNGFVALMVICCAHTGTAQTPTPMAAESVQQSPWPAGTMIQNRPVAVALIRIDSTEAPQPCERSVRAHHRATVLSTGEGTLPSEVELDQTDGGVCMLHGQPFTHGTPYKRGDQFIAFLVSDGAGAYTSVAGGATMLKLRRGRVTRPDWPPVTRGLRVDAAWTALRAALR